MEQTTRSTPEPERSRKRRVKIVDEIIETLRQDIVSRRLPHGERLATEKELSDRFGASQPTIREAIRALETIGLVEVLHGNGSFVRSQGNYVLASALQTLMQLESVGILDVLDVRQLPGRHSIRAAASQATAADVMAIEAASARFDRPGELKEIDQVIACFIDCQRARSAASHNPLLTALETFLLALLNEVQVKSLTGRGLQFWRARALQFQPHRIAILDGVRSVDPEAACAAMDRYFIAQRGRFEQDKALRSLNLGSPKLIAIVSEMVRHSRE